MPNIKLGTDTLTGVSTVLFTDADDQTKQDTFSYGETQTKTTTITANGTTAVTADSGKLLSSVGITVNVQPTLQEKTATPSTSSQEITADSGKDGLSKVTVSAVTSSIDANIVAGNIKKDVVILGVTGTHEGGGSSIGYNVTLNVDGSTWQVIQVLSGNSMAFPTTPTKTGYAFGGWSTISGATTPNVTFPYTPSGNVTLYAVFNTWQCVVSGLGSSDPTSVTFTHTGTMPTLEQVTVNGNIFLKIPTMYRKINSYSSQQITSYTIAMTNVDGTYTPYSVFVKEDGATVMDYVLMGKYRSSAASGSMNSTTGTPVTQAIGTARTGARALGTGYQQYDWQFQKLWQDLITCKMNTININSGSGISEDALGFEWNNSGCWIDGIVRNNNQWIVSSKPTTYVDSATSATTGYSLLGYSAPGSSSMTSGEISKLGYDSSNPFVNYPYTIVTNTSYNTYYCDYYAYSTSQTNAPVYSNVGYSYALLGAFHCSAGYSWSLTDGVRLCYRPL